MNLNVFSEISPLKNVIIHSPIGEHQYLKKNNTKESLDNNENPDFLLFDEIVNSKILISEHQKLKSVLDCFTNNNTITFQELLNEILEDFILQKKIIREVIISELSLYGKNEYLSEKKFEGLSSKQISNVLITGYLNQNQIFKFPLPNLIFTRDIGAVIGNTLLTTWSWHKSRQRESIITSFIIKHHPMFKNFDIFSQRTPLKSIEALLPTIFKNNFKYVYAIELPKKRKFMHLDCVFTKININECLVYPPLFINNEIDYKIYRYNAKLDCLKIHSKDQTLLETFTNDGYNLTFIGCGGEKRANQDLELLTMGANVFNLKPGIIIGYFQNKETIKELNKHNYTIISSEEFCQNKNLDKNRKYFIYLDENELSRGHGGIRCLTFPIERENINE